MKFKPLLRWMTERHKIYLRRQSGLSRPWTNDAILQQYKFTNVRRELDRVSQDLISVLDAHKSAPDEEKLFNILVYRTFNLPHVYDGITGLRTWIKRWEPDRVISRLASMQDKGKRIFTGAYMMNAVGSDGQRKYIMYVDRLSMMYRDRRLLTNSIKRANTIRFAVSRFATYRNIGQFVAYEFATDLTYIDILRNADDIMTWANPGPGAVRGLNRLLDLPVRQKMKEEKAVECMQELLRLCTAATDPEFWGRPLVMRDIEHSLCEFDKYERVRLGQGRPRSRYRGI